MVTGTSKTNKQTIARLNKQTTNLHVHQSFLYIYIMFLIQFAVTTRLKRETFQKLDVF